MGVAVDLVLQLATEGRSWFTTPEAQRLLGRSEQSTAVMLRSLRKQGFIATPIRGLHTILPPEHRKAGSLPAEQLTTILFAYWKQPYYVSLLSAAELLGASHQRPQRFQVITARARKKVRCGSVEIELLGRHTVTLMPTTTMNTARGPLVVASPGTLAFDLVAYAARAGGLDNVATVLSELAPRLGVRALTQLARSGVSEVPVVQRLGYLLDLLGHQPLTKGLEGVVAEAAIPHPPLLVPGGKSGAVDVRWRLVVNHVIERDE